MNSPSCPALWRACTPFFIAKAWMARTSPAMTWTVECPMSKFVRYGAVALAVLATISTPTLAQPATYPSRNVEIIVPYGPRGSTDIVARIVAQSCRTGSANVRRARPAGASGTLGLTRRCARPDGYTLLNSYTAEAVVVPQISRPTNIRSDDFEPIAITGLCRWC